MRKNRTGQRGAMDPVKRDQIVARLRQGEAAKDIAVEMGVGLSTVYHIREKELPEQKPQNQMAVPNLRTMEGVRDSVAVSMTTEEFAGLTGKSEAVMIAAAVKQDSLKTHTLRTIVEQGPFPDVLTLMRAMRRGPEDTFGSHEVTHLIKESLGKQGLISYRVSRKNSGAGAVPTQIKATEKGYDAVGYIVPAKDIENKHGAHPPGWSRAKHAVGKDYTEQKYHGHRAEGGPIEMRWSPTVPDDVQAVVNAPEPQLPEPAPVRASGSYPILDGLLKSFQDRAAADQRAAAYMDAAASLETADPEEAQRLMAKAIEISPAPLSDIEREYLQFAADHQST